MTKQQFLTALRKTPRTWHLTKVGELRSGCHCPLTEVALEAGAAARNVPDAAECVVAGKYLQLQERTVTQIVNATDRYWDRDVQATRRALLRACGIEEARA